MKRFKMPVAVHLFLQSDTEILLLRRYNTGYEDGNYSVIAGHVDGHEDFISAMIREAKEEAGIQINKEDMLPVQVMHRKTMNDERIDYFFVANKWQGEPINTEPHKCDQLIWCSTDHLPTNTIPYIHYALNQYSQQNYFTKFGWENDNETN